MVKKKDPANLQKNYSTVYMLQYKKIKRSINISTRGAL